MTHALNGRIIPILLLVSLIPISCRTYGGYGSEEALLRQIELATETFASDLEAAKADLQALGGEAGRVPVLQPVAHAFEQAVAEHQALVEAHRSELEAATDRRGSYRYLSRTFGGILADQESMYARYDRLLRIAEARTDTATTVEPSRHAGMRYHVVPPYFERLRNSDALEGTGGAARRLSAPASR